MKKEYELNVGDDVYVKATVKQVMDSDGDMVLKTKISGTNYNSNYAEASQVIPASALQEVPEFQQGETVEVSDDARCWFERTYAITHGEHYYVVDSGYEKYHKAEDFNTLYLIPFHHIRKLLKEDNYDLTLTRNGEKVDLNILSDFSILALKNGKMGERTGS